MPSKTASVLLLGAATYVSSSVYTAFTAAGGKFVGRVSVRNGNADAGNLQLSAPTNEATSPASVIAGSCMLGAIAVTFAAAKARSKRVAQRANPRNFNEQFAASSGPASITVGKDGPSSFEILIAGLAKAGLTDVLNGPGPFTVFAPDDLAFAASGLTAEAVLAHPDLATILKMHVVSGIVSSESFKNTPIETLGGAVTMRKGVKGVMMNKATIKKTNCEIKNGMMHIIGSVILP